MIYIIKQKIKKKLSFVKLLDHKIFSVEDEFRNKIAITYDGKTAKDLRLLLIKLINTGNAPILKSDFEDNIAIKLSVKIDLGL